ncbi:Pentatricopeptide repeat-containing protein, partial [Thalictrum thalictroides]
SKRVYAVTPEEAELVAIKVGVTYALSHGVHHLVVGSDNESVVKVLQNRSFEDGDVSLAWNLHESLLYLRSVFDRIWVPDTFAWNTIIRAYSHISPLEALTLFFKMRKEGVSLDNFTFPFVLKASSLIQRGTELHSLVVKLGFHSDIFVQNSLIHIYGSCGLVDNSMKVFNEMDEKDLVSWSSAIGCLVDNGFNNEALELFREMQLSMRIRPDEVTMVSVISAVSSLGCLELVHGRSREALNVFNEMRKSGLWPDYTTFIGVLVACSHGGLVEEGWNVFRSIKNEYGMEPGLEHYGSMVDLLGRAGLLGQAYEFIEKMPICANSVVWRTLLGACVNHGNLELAKQVKEKLSIIDPYHDGDYVLLSNVYGGVQRWGDKAKVRSSMRKQSIEKKPGCSLIEINWVIHEFVSGDNSHPKYETVRNVLSSIIQRLSQAGYAPDTNSVLFDVDEEEKEKNLSFHSEKMAVAFSLLVDNDKTTIRVMKNLRICTDCHRFMKYVSKVFHKEIIIRDRSRFHHFIQGSCSCRDYW